MIPKDYLIAEMLENRESNNHMCKTHSGLVREFYCENCKISFCKSCLIENHKKHDFCDLGKIMEK